MKQNVYIEFYGEQVFQEDLIQEAQKIWAESGKKPEELRKISLYVKPEDNRVYYVFNEEEEGSFPILDNQNY